MYISSPTLVEWCDVAIGKAILYKVYDPALCSKHGCVRLHDNKCKSNDMRDVRAHAYVNRHIFIKIYVHISPHSKVNV